MLHVSGWLIPDLKICFCQDVNLLNQKYRKCGDHVFSNFFKKVFKIVIWEMMGSPYVHCVKMSENDKEIGCLVK